MSTPAYNEVGENGLTPLIFADGGMTGNLSTSGNAVRVRVGRPQPRILEYAPVGGDWTLRRTLGQGPRRVVWECALKSPNDAALNDIEAEIDSYLVDGRAYALTDGFGRDTDWAVLVSEGTEPVGSRMTTTTGAKVQRWRLTFDVLLPTGGGL